MRVIIIISIWMLSVSLLIYPMPATAATRHFQWQGLKGYKVTGDYVYDTHTHYRGNASQIIHEQGRGQTNQIEALQVRFYDPTGKLIYQHDDIVNGVSSGKYFVLNLNPTTQELSGKLDIGGENIQELFLGGTVNGGLALIEIDAAGVEQILDRDK